MATKNHSQIAQRTISTVLTPRKRHEGSEVQNCWCEVWHNLVEIRLNSLVCRIPSEKAKNPSLSKLKTSEETVSSMNTGPNISMLDNAHHTADFCGCSELATTSLGFSETQNRAVCLLKLPSKWKCASSENHMIFKTTGLCSSNAPHSLAKAQSIAFHF
jgi:hypothetical protein